MLDVAEDMLDDIAKLVGEVVLGVTDFVVIRKQLREDVHALVFAVVLTLASLDGLHMGPESSKNY